ncbi:MAG: hypothetical protein AB7O59_15475 [Pirellulales bacterium]
MSIADHPSRPALGHRAPGWFAGGAPHTTPASRLVAAWHALRANRPLFLGILWGLTAWVALETAFLAWAHRNLEGVTQRAFLPGQVFGVPEREAAANYHPVSRVGYDGQFYYWMSNDIFARYDAQRHMDAPLYRYQRIGIPMLAGGLATAMGLELTPARLYHTLQFGLTSAGFGALVYWLKRNGLNPAYALGWLISGGTLQSLWLGILDAPSDAMFVFTLLAVLGRRLLWYVPIATLMLLTREGYVVYALAMFLATAAAPLVARATGGRAQRFGCFAWRDVGNYWHAVVLAAVPGVVMLSWTAYLAIHFQLSPTAVRGGSDATHWPYYMMAHYAEVFFRRGNWFELRLLLVSGFSLLLISALLVRDFRHLPVALICTVPYVLLTAALGNMVWEAWIGHMKASGAILVIGLFLMPFDKSVLLRFVLMLQAVVGVDLQTQLRVMDGQLLCPHLIHEQGGPPAGPPREPDNALLTDLRSSLEWTDRKPLRLDYRGVFLPLHREVRPVTIAVTNHTDATWQPGDCKHPIWLGYRLHKVGSSRELARHSVVLSEPIGPGETKHVITFLELWGSNCEFAVEFSLWQDGVGWFADADPSFGRRYKYRVE